MPGFIDLVKVLFRNYYRGVDISEISDLERREFGFQFFDKEGMIRHMAFKSGDELKHYLVSNVPSTYITHQPFIMILPIQIWMRRVGSVPT